MVPALMVRVLQRAGDCVNVVLSGNDPNLIMAPPESTLEGVLANDDHEEPLNFQKLVEASPFSAYVY